MKKITFVLTLSLMLFYIGASAQDTLAPNLPNLPNLSWAYVYKVFDGDNARLILLNGKPDSLPIDHTTKNLPKGNRVKIRFLGVDAPEIKNNYGASVTQPWGLQSRDSLRSLILYKYVLVDTIPLGKKKFSYDRLLVDMYVPEQSPGFLNHYIVAKGWAWARPSVRPDKTIEDLLLETGQMAQKNRVGMFSQKVNGRWYRNILPSTWRAKYKNK